jgi:predicted enzyme related to lactoylglutathione lyase
MKIKDVAFTVYPTNDVARSRAWYEENLGLSFAGPYVEDGVEKYNEAHFSNGCFALMSSEWVGREPGSAASIVFEVDDVEKGIASLRARGLAVEDVFVTPVCKQTSLTDEDGNKVSLHQRTR